MRFSFYTKHHIKVKDNESDQETFVNQGLLDEILAAKTTTDFLEKYLHKIEIEHDEQQQPI